MLNIFVYNVKKLEKKEKIKSMYLDYLELDNFKQIILDNLIMDVNYLPYIKYTGFFGGIPWFEQGYTIPHTAVLPIELYPPYKIFITNFKASNIYIYIYIYNLKLYLYYIF